MQLENRFVRGYYKLIGKTSFSQCGEDLIIKYLLRKLGIKTPSYIDIGAYDPIKLSNTCLFYIYGSRGINIEPNPDRFSKFVTKRSNDINLNIGIGPKDDVLDYFFYSDSTLNSFSISERNSYARNFEASASEKYRLIKTKKIKVREFNSVVEEYKFQNVDFLTIDAEGMDSEIIKSIDFSFVRPKVICYESVEHDPFGRGVKRNELQDFLMSLGYVEYSFTGLNTIVLDSRFV